MQLADIPYTAACIACGYRLCGLSHPRCPECGNAFDPADPQTFDIYGPGPIRRLLLSSVVRNLFAGVLAVLFLHDASMPIHGAFVTWLIAPVIAFTLVLLARY